jgi:hypothetical protein
MLTKDSEIVVYLKNISNKLTSTSTRQIPWFEQFEHVFLFEFIQVIHQEVKSRIEIFNFFFQKFFFNRNRKSIYHRFIMKFYFHYYHHF